MTSERWRSIAALLLGVLIVVAVAAIPVIGPVVNLLAVLIGLGAVVLVGWEQRARRGGAAAGEVPAPMAEPLPAPHVPVSPAA